MTAGASLSLTLGNPVVAGDILVVFAGWHDATGNVLQVFDSLGTVYSVAASTTRTSVSQVTYEGRALMNAADLNVTAMFSATLTNPTLRVAQVRGADTGGSSGGSFGAGSNATGCQATTLVTMNNTLLVGANTSPSAVSAVGPGQAIAYTNARGDVLFENKVATAASTTSSVTLAAPADCVVQVVQLPL